MLETYEYYVENGLLSNDQLSNIPNIQKKLNYPSSQTHMIWRVSEVPREVIDHKKTYIELCGGVNYIHFNSDICEQ